MRAAFEYPRGLLDIGVGDGFLRFSAAAQALTRCSRYRVGEKRDALAFRDE
jgi:hypothetical protein